MILIALIVILSFCLLSSCTVIITVLLRNRYLWAAKITYKLLFPKKYKDYKEALTQNIPTVDKNSGEPPEGFYIYVFSANHRALFYDDECILSEGPLLDNLIKNNGSNR